MHETTTEYEAETITTVSKLVKLDYYAYCHSIELINAELLPIFEREIS